MKTGTAVITGAGRGLGAAIARRLAAEGRPVVVNDLDPVAAEETAGGIARAGGRAVAISADATDPEQVAAMVQAARERFGPVLVTVANASGPQGEVPVEELSWTYMLRHFEFFTKSPLALLHAAVADMRAAGWGRVVHIGSDLFDRADPGWSAYMAAKGALLGLTRGWALELGGDGITVNLVAPGWIPVERHGTIPAEVAEHWLGRQAVRRWGTPDDVAGAVAYLASEEAGFVSGQRIVVNGGFHFT
ncbi:SDR family NAD(P)-dependent oxidoreductase [Marinitenerispora sediminis]|uniref:3-oxoacyl-ACP reductase n=1 Tax=Marinitenerispora sediminis TaxID=1931232 RepID=A0A368T4G1_9ACTN|nr:SDR family oxidoreductase [Marinitenerispora sediminis]RCV57578.1 3-oxoacyl-ACP reductase [Marinitenerispora sediminis]RCV58293.1 3-oxoacyl-ACP reductase [Marinitenerispora sediminis]RCV59676.1 3-oxoacyl-ACP reductase [Marinitenerispora sediminis]